MNRRTFLATTTAVAIAPTIGETRERRIGFGHHAATGEMLHEEYCYEVWDGEKWADTFERRIWWMQHGDRQERRYVMKFPELGF